MKHPPPLPLEEAQARLVALAPSMPVENVAILLGGAAYLGWLPLQTTWAAFMAHSITPFIFTGLAIVELIMDKLPTTPSRKSPPSFAARIISGAFSGSVLGAAVGTTLIGLVAGAIGSVLGTLGGYEFRTRLAKATGHDVPNALLEDGIALAGAFLIVRFVL